MTSIPDRAPLWTVQDLADFLQVPVNTVYKWRTTGGGPPAVKVGRYVRYRGADVSAWLVGLSEDGA